VQSLKKSLDGIKQKYDCKTHKYNKIGKAEGMLIGGNLSLIAHLIGTPDDLKTDGCILFLEDVGEQLYNIDRMLTQLKRSGKLAKLNGVIFGGFTDCKDTDRPFGKKIIDILYEAVNEYDYPVCFNFPVSHNKENYALKCGANFQLNVGKDKIVLQEL
jgi:muramoyltetrapeptide carboxypeptidase